MEKIKDILIYEPLEWQKKALNKFNKVSSKIKFLQKIGGAGKTYLCIYYALTKYKENAKIAVICSPNQSLSWKKTFKDFDFDFISTGIINKKDYKNNKYYDIVLFDEVDSHAKNVKTNTMKNFIKLNKKEAILISATLISGNYINSMNWLRLVDWSEERINHFFTFEKNYNIPDTIKMRNAKNFVLVNSGINPDLKKQYERIFSSYGHIELDDISLNETNITEISKLKKDNDFIFNFEKVELKSPKILKIQKSIIKHSFIEETTYLLGKSYEKYNTLLELSSGFIPNNLGVKKLVDAKKIITTYNIIQKFNLKQVFIFYNNTVECEILKRYLTKYLDIPVYVNTEAKEIDEDENFILLGHYRSIGRGLDFKRLQALILFSPTETYEEFKQALYRLGRESSIYKNMYIWEIYYKDTLHNEIFNKQNQFENFNKNEFIKNWD